ncbi:MAG: hypothetical protein CSB32_01820 [Desulfobacterales bacterium]|nr:MAG: hypothetical protein CSB32_01820 [Desulfobacterales bacterium]
MPTSQKFRDAKRIMGLDQFGYPANAIANRILVNMDDFGVNTKDLITTWYTWLHYNPFDTQVSEKLTELLAREVQTLDPGNRLLPETERYVIANWPENLTQYDDTFLLPENPLSADPFYCSP